MTFAEQIAFDSKNNNKVRLEDLKGSKVYKLRVKVLRNKELTPEERLWISQTINFQNNTRYITLERWVFDFRPVISRYMVMLDDMWEEYAATDVPTLLEMLGIDKEDTSVNFKNIRCEAPQVLEDYIGPIYDNTPITPKSIVEKARTLRRETLARYMEDDTVYLAVRIR